jgi:Fuc2NAc and GlcNAc transferase
VVSRAEDDVSALAVALPAFVAAVVLTGLVRRHAVRHGLIDVPNERSSHVTPTPRGGGLAIVVVTLSGAVVLAGTGVLRSAVAVAVLGGALVAWVGWLDDRRGVPAAIRVLAHFAAAAWALWWLGGMPMLIVGRESVSLGAFGWLLAAVAIVWAVNLTNFMDGIDGLAGTEAATVSLTAAALLAAADPGVAALAAVTGAAALGFLGWNWQPARVFMGDVGSGFLGYLLAVLGVASENHGTLPVGIWILLYMVFAVDGTITLLRRAARGERWYAAHRSHAYQRAAQAGWSHARITLAVFALNVALGFLACWAAADRSRLGAALALSIVLCGGAYAIVGRVRPMDPVGSAAQVDAP